MVSVQDVLFAGILRCALLHELGVGVPHQSARVLLGVIKRGTLISVNAAHILAHMVQATREEVAERGSNSRQLASVLDLLRFGACDGPLLCWLTVGRA